MAPTHELTFFLRELGIIRLKYLAQYKEANFNIFSILRKEHDEVHLHSAFIAELLNPKGSHGMGSAFLKHFLNEAKIPCDPTLELENVTADVERRFAEYGQIDILVWFPQRILIIENKINAADGDKQLKRYYDFANKQGFKKKNIHILYLTMRGSEPSQQSLDYDKAVDESVIRVSYQFEVTKWLIQCVREAALAPPLRETLVQYSNLIKKLTGNSMNESNRQEVIGVLSQGNNALLGKAVVDAWNYMKRDTSRNFWQEFESKLKALAAIYPAYKVLSLQKYSEDYLEGLYFRTRGKNANFGIIAHLGPINGSTEDAIALGIDTDSNILCFGLMAVRNESNREISLEPVFEDFRKQFSIATSPGGTNTWWLASQYFSSKNIDLPEYSNEDTLDLVNEEKRKATIDILYEEILRFLKNCRVEEALKLTPNASTQ